MSGITAAELRSVLEAVERREVSLMPEGRTADEIYAGDVSYCVSNGWRLVVFNDCNDWDYLDSAVAPDGRRVEYPSGLEPFDEDLHGLFISYVPPPDVVREVYGFTR